VFLIIVLGKVKTSTALLSNASTTMMRKSAQYQESQSAEIEQTVVDTLTGKVSLKLRTKWLKSPVPVIAT